MDDVKIRRVISLAEEYRKALDAPSTDGEGPASMAHEPTSANQRLLTYLKSFSSEEIQEIVVLMWIGRDDIASSRTQLLASAAGITQPVHYLMEKKPLAEYLEQGLLKWPQLKIAPSYEQTDGQPLQRYRALLRARYLNNKGEVDVLAEEVHVFATDSADAKSQFRVYPKMQPSQENWDVSYIERID